MAVDASLTAALAAAGIDPSAALSIGRGDRVWATVIGSSPIVLRKCELRVARWLHPSLGALAARVPVPAPARIFRGDSVSDQPGGAWEALTWLPGKEVGWDAQPSLHEIGAFLARYHDASLQLQLEVTARPGGTPLIDLANRVDWNGAHVTMGSVDGVEHLRRQLIEFRDDLGRHGYREAPSCLIHGDPTTFNVLAVGEPPRTSGLIDFELADVEAAVADIAFCLWRSGRPHQGAVHLDLSRVRELVAGYQSVRSLTTDELALIPLCLRGRGLQMLVKRSNAHSADRGPLARVHWLRDHHIELANVLR